MNRLKKIIFFAILLIGGLCAMNAQEKTTTACVPVVKLNNGVEMPRFGLGTFLQGSNEICKQSCLTALRAGYRLHMLTTMKKVWVKLLRKAAFHAKKSG